MADERMAKNGFDRVLHFFFAVCLFVRFYCVRSYLSFLLTLFKGNSSLLFFFLPVCAVICDVRCGVRPPFLTTYSFLFFFFLFLLYCPFFFKGCAFPLLLRSPLSPICIKG